MTRKELHNFLSKYFPNTKHYLFEIFDVNLDDILEEAEKLKGYKISVKFKEKPKMIEESGLTDTIFYNAFLEVLLKQYSLEEVKEEINRWKGKDILQFV